MITVKEAARMMGVSERSVYLVRELQHCSRPDLCERVKAGDLTILQALRIAKPEKYAKRDKVEQWVAAYRAWDPETRLRAIEALMRS